MATDPRGKITLGKDFNFFQEVTLANTSFNTLCDVAFNFRGQVSFSLVNEGTATVEYSFNGTNLHGTMKASTPTSAIFFDNRRVSKIWFRIPSGVSTLIRIEAWAAF